MARRRKWKNKPRELREQAAFDKKLKKFQRPLVPVFPSQHFTLEEQAGMLRHIETNIGGPISQAGGLS